MRDITPKGIEDRLDAATKNLSMVAYDLEKVASDYFHVIEDVVAALPADRALAATKDLGQQQGQLQAAVSLLREVEAVVRYVGRKRLYIAGEKGAAWE